MPFSLNRIKEYQDFKKSVFMLNARMFPKRFQYECYQKFHSHLPEELFFEDFMEFFKKANNQTFKQFNKAFELINQNRANEEISE